MAVAGSVAADAHESGIVPCHRNSGEGLEIKVERRGGHRQGAGRPRKRLQSEIVVRLAAEPRWCVVATRKQAEISATRAIARAGYVAYLPMIAVRRRDAVVKSLWHITAAPVFEGYTFVRLGPTDPLVPIMDMRCVHEVLRNAEGRPWRLPEGAVEKLMAAEEERMCFPAEAAPALAAGAAVHFAFGPYTGFPGVVIGCDGNRTQVGVEMFGRTTPVWVDRAHLEARVAA